MIFRFLQKKAAGLIFGFSLIEFIVVVSIIIFMAGLIVPNYLAYHKTLKLNRSAQILAQSLRRVLEMATSAQEMKAGNTSLIPSGGYGLYLRKISASNYEIFFFGDCDNNANFTAAANPCLGFPEKIAGSDIFLEAGVSLQNLNPNSSNSLSILMRPPDPTIYFNGSPASGNATITLSIESLQKTITINKTGLVDVE
jgi:type II secretory pathway pseudopilin PulG